jgi:hypothetical protein
MDWGKPSDDQGKLAFSFYLASNKLQPTLRELKATDGFMSLLAKMGLTMNRHHLFETEEKRLGFFLGKSPDRTWRGDLESRFHDYLSKVFSQANLCQLREQTDTFPSWIPFSIRNAQLPGKVTATSAIMIYVGKSHMKYMEQILQRFPFHLEIVLMASQRKDRAQFAKHVELHGIICKNSRAIKLLEATDQFITLLHDIASSNSSVADIILDIAGSSNPGVIFIQYMPRARQALTEWLRVTLADHLSNHPADTTVVADFERQPHEPTTRQWSKHQHFLDDEAYISPKPAAAPQQAKTKQSWKHLPSIILTCEHKSYASAASLNEPASQMSSPTNSVLTQKTLQDDIETLKQEIATLRKVVNKQDDAVDTLSETSKKSAREIALEEIILDQNESIAAQSAREEAMMEHLHQQQTEQAERENHLIAHINTQAATHKAEMAEIKSAYAQMLEIMQTMNQKLEKMSPPRKRASRKSRHDTLSTREELSSSSMDTDISLRSDDIKFPTGDLSVIQDLSVTHPEQDHDHVVQSDSHWSQDLPAKPPPC